MADKEATAAQAAPAVRAGRVESEPVFVPPKSAEAGMVERVEPAVAEAREAAARVDRASRFSAAAPRVQPSPGRRWSTAPVGSAAHQTARKAPKAQTSQASVF